MFLLKLAAFFGLFAASIFFSAAEAAVTALSALRIKRLSVAHPALRPALSEWLTHPHRLLTTILIGNNFVNVAASSLFYALALPLTALAPKAAVDAALWLLLTATLVAGGEVFPKIVGRAYREQVCAWGMPVLSVFKKLLFWAWAPVGWALERTVPRLAQAPANPLMVTSLEELRHALGESESQGEVAPDQAAMIRRTLTLHERTAADILTPAEKVDGLSMDLLGGRGGTDFYADVLIETGRTRVPVFRRGEVVGYVNAMDLLGPREAPPIEALLRPLRRVPPDVRVLDLLQLFKTSGDPVAAVQRGSAFLGIVTLEDVLEEIVGEILDEYDAEQKK